MTQLTNEQQLILLPQVTEMLAKEAYHYCADCKAHCRQLILTVEALKELNRAYTALLDSDSQAAGDGGDVRVLSQIRERAADGYERASGGSEVKAGNLMLNDLHYVLSSHEGQYARGATRMRDKCVEKVRARRTEKQIEADARRDPDNPLDYHGSYSLAVGAVDVCDDILADISSLTLDELEPEKRT